LATYSDTARQRRDEYTNIYEETSEPQWNGAVLAFDDIAVTCDEYGMKTLEGGLSLRTDYTIPGMPGISILRELVNIDPEKYASQVGIASESYVVVSSSDWLLWNEELFDFELVDFDDSSWRKASRSNFPDTVRVGIPQVDDWGDDWGEDGDDWGEEETESAEESFEFTQDDTLAPDTTINDTIEIAEADTVTEEVGVVIDVDFGILDSLDANPIWYTSLLPDEMVMPEYPDTVNIDTLSLFDTLVMDTAGLSEMSLEELEEAGFSGDVIEEPVVPEVIENVIQDTTDISEVVELEFAEDSLTVDTTVVEVEGGLADLGTPEEIEAVLEAQRQAFRDSTITEAIAAEQFRVQQSYERVSYERDSLSMEYEQADSLWRVWVLPDSSGQRNYWFRYYFDVDETPSRAYVWLDGGDEFNLYLNGESIDVGDLNPSLDD
ncbi:MAG: hypothetical protein P9M15_08065, partial [Candidatus Electryoneaceae bacterium]|nr:hypothetical protein [Candidatus Electryoneaceae bacterium]